MKKAIKSLLALVLVLTVFAGFLPAKVQAEAAAEQAEEPVMRIAFFSDLHIEFGLQDNATAVRPSTIKAAKAALALTDGEGFDVVLVGGDMTGHRGNWTTEKVTKVKKQIHETMTGITKDGKVLYVGGNHDQDSSEAAKAVGTDDFSGCYADLMTKTAGEFVSALYSDDISKNLSPFNEILCYRYTFGGMEFIGISTPHLAELGASGLYPQQTQWLEDEMAKIGKDKTVFILCHYPEDALFTYLNKSTVSASNICKDQLMDIFATYPNIVYCYGHHHSGENWWARSKSTDLVKVPDGMSLAGANLYKAKGYISSHMGSMGYYDTPYQPGGLTTADPECVQFVTVDVYADRLTFQVHNAGAQPAKGGKMEVSPISFARDLADQLGVEAPQKNPANPQNPSGSAPAATDGANATATGGQNGNNLLPILLLGGLGVVLVACVVVLVLVLGKKKPQDAPAEEPKAEAKEEPKEEPKEE